MFIPDPGSWFLPILDPGSKNRSKREGWKKICCHTFFCSNKFHIIENYFIFKMLKKKICASFQRIIELFTQKIVTKLSKIWVWDPRSGIRDPGSGKNLFRIPDPGVTKAPDPGSGSATLVYRPTQVWFWPNTYIKYIFRVKIQLFVKASLQGSALVWLPGSGSAFKPARIHNTGTKKLLFISFLCRAIPDLFLGQTNAARSVAIIIIHKKDLFPTNIFEYFLNLFLVISHW